MFNVINSERRRGSRWPAIRASRAAGAEAGETPEDAAAREVLEETGRIEWLPLAEVKAVCGGQVRDSLSLTALVMAMLFELPME